MTNPYKKEIPKKKKKTLQDYIFLVLNQLPIIDDLSFVEDVINNIDSTTIKLFKPYFEEASTFYQEHKKFPDIAFIMGRLDCVIPDLSDKPYSPDMIADFKSLLVQESATFQAVQALYEGDTEKAKTFLEFNKGRDTLEKPLFMDDIVDVYDKFSQNITGLTTGCSDVDDVIRILGNGTLTTVAGGPGDGKALSLTTNVLTDKGYMPMGSLKVGQLVVGSDGELYPITGVHPQGVLQEFRVIFDDATHISCCKDHLWEVSIPDVFTQKILTTMDLFLLKRDIIKQVRNPQLKDNITRDSHKTILGVRALHSWIEMQCISVASPDHLYIVDNYTLTHNTTYGVSILYNNLVQKKNMILFNFEITARDSLFNIVSREALELGLTLPAGVLKKGVATDDEKTYLKQAQQSFLNRPDLGKYVIINPSMMNEVTPAEAARIIKHYNKEWEADGGVHGFVWDYLQLMKGYMLQGIRDEKERMNFWTRFLATLCVALDIPGVLLSQMSREGRKKFVRSGEGDLSFLSEANELERSSSVVIELYSTESNRLGSTMNISIPKHRNGATHVPIMSVYANFPQFKVGQANFNNIFTLDSFNKISNAPDTGGNSFTDFLFN